MLQINNLDCMHGAYSLELFISVKIEFILFMLLIQQKNINRNAGVFIFYWNIFVTIFFRVDPFSKKEWYNVKVPAYFAVRNIGKTIVTKTVGTSMFD